MTEYVILLHHTTFLSKLSVPQLRNIPRLLQELQKFIAVFTWPQSHTVACSQYTVFMKIYILYYSIKIAIPRIKLIQFTCALAREILWTGTYHYIFPSLPYFISLFYLTIYVRVEKIVTIFTINCLKYTNFYS